MTKTTPGTSGHEAGEIRRSREHVEALRLAIGRDVAELEDRLRDALDLGRQARRHPVAATLLVFTAGLTTGALAAALWRRRTPGRVVRSAPVPRSSLGHRVLVSTATALGALCAREVGKLLLDRLLNPRAGVATRPGLNDAGGCRARTP